MAKFCIGLLSGVLLTLLFFETFPGGAAQGIAAVGQTVKTSTP
jgi:hypothetical protein